MAKQCILCKSQNYLTQFIEEGIPIVECRDCGHVYSTYSQDVHYEGYWDDDTAEYDLDWWDLAHRGVYKEFIRSFLKQDSGTLLDVGCGLGFFVKSVQEQRPNWKVLGYEISKKAVAFANDVNKLPNVKSGLVQNSGIGKASVDVITLWDVIEHIPEPHSLLEYLFSLLKPGGKLFLQTPNFPIQLVKANLKLLVFRGKPGVHYLEVRDHIQNYKMETIQRLGSQIGFKSSKVYVMTPILSVAGGSGKLGVFLKLGYYYVTKFLFQLSFGKLNWNNTLFVIFTK